MQRQEQRVDHPYSSSSVLVLDRNHTALVGIDNRADSNSVVAAVAAAAVEVLHKVGDRIEEVIDNTAVAVEVAVGDSTEVVENLVGSVRVVVVEEMVPLVATSRRSELDVEPFHRMDTNSLP